MIKEDYSSFAIKLNQVTFSYEKDHTIFQNLTFSVKKGEAVGLIGANGCGKSTLLRMLCGLLDHEGEMEVAGLPVTRQNFVEIRKKIGFVFQDSDSQLFMPRVYDDIAFAPRNYGMKAEETEKIVDQVLERTGIQKLKFKQNYKMSGGEKRMACIAVALALEPEILLMDEPSIALDPFNRRTLIQNLNEMKETRLIASHDLDMIYETCERVILLDPSGIRADGPAEEILRNQELMESCRLELPFCLQKIQPYQRKTEPYMTELYIKKKLVKGE